MKSGYLALAAALFATGLVPAAAAEQVGMILQGMRTFPCPETPAGVFNQCEADAILYTHVLFEDGEAMTLSIPPDPRNPAPRFDLRGFVRDLGDRHLRFELVEACTEAGQPLAVALGGDRFRWPENSRGALEIGREGNAMPRVPFGAQRKRASSDGAEAPPLRISTGSRVLVSIASMAAAPGQPRCKPFDVWMRAHSSVPPPSPLYGLEQDESCTADDRRLTEKYGPEIEAARRQNEPCATERVLLEMAVEARSKMARCMPEPFRTNILREMDLNIEGEQKKISEKSCEHQSKR